MSRPVVQTSATRYRSANWGWRQRWQKEFERLTRIEGIEEPIQLRRAIEELLSDEHRSGRKPTFSAEQLTLIFAVACEAVEESGRPVARWTQREIVDEVIKRGIVPYISKSHMNTHWSASLVLWVILLEGLTLSPEEVGAKGKSGILKNQESRQAFLTAAERRIRFIYVPKHSSWLNQVEIWFSVVVRRVIRRGEFTSTEALKTRLLEFIDYFNATLAKPYCWTFEGKLLTA